MPSLVATSDETLRDERRQAWKHGLCLTLLCAFVYLTGLGSTHLWDDDETYFAQVAREMFDRGDVIVPWFNQELFAHKPPVMYWLMMGAYQIFGVSEFAARLPAALFGWANVLLLWRLGRRLYSPQAGFWAGVVLATSLNFVVIARAAACDAELTFFCTLAVTLFVRAVWTTAGQATPGLGTGRPSTAAWCGIYAAMGCAVLTKGPIGVLLPGCVIGLFLLLQHGLPEPGASVERPAEWTWRNRLASSLRWVWSVLAPWRIARTVWEMRPFLACAMVLAVAGPWFAAVAWRTQGEFLVGFFGTHHFHRFTATMDNHAGPAWFYLAAICVGFFPWILLARPAVMEEVARFRADSVDRPATLLLIAWCVAWVGFFSLATTKFPHYVVPAYPALALFTGCFIARWLARPELCAGLSRSAIWLSLLLIGVGITVVTPLVAAHLRVEASRLWIPGIPVVIGATVAWRMSRRGRLSAALSALTLSTAQFLVVLFAVAAVEVDRGQTTVALARDMRGALPEGELQIATWRFFRPGLVYYTAEQIGVSRIERLETPEAVAQWLGASTGPRFVVARANEFAAAREKLPAGIEVVAQQPWFLKAGNDLVLLRWQGTEPRSAAATGAQPDSGTTVR